MVPGVPGAVGRGGTGYGITGTGSLSLKTSPTFGGRQSFALEAWVRPTVKVDYRHVFTKMFFATGTTKTGTYLYIYDPDGLLGFESWREGTNTAAASQGSIHLPGDRYSYLVGTSDGRTYRLYLDAALIMSGEMKEGSAETDDPARWGWHFIGDLDELALYDKALSRARISAHHAAASAARGL